MFLLITLTILFGFVLRTYAWDANNPESVKEYLYYVSTKEGLNVTDVLAVAKCESGIRANAVGDHGNSYGVFQIHLPSHPSVTKEMALNPFLNINWAIDKLLEGKWSMWTCARQLGLT